MDFNSISHYIKYIELRTSEIPNFDSYPFNLPIVSSLKRLDFHPKVTYLVGENGMGKSTLLEAIATKAGFNPEGGSLNSNFSTYDSHSNLDKYIKVAKGAIKASDGFFLRAESFYNLATNIEELDNEPSSVPKIIDSYGGISLHEQSHGESFFATFLNRFAGNGIYLLDEPEAALSPLRQLSMLSRIDHLVQQHSQFIIATHSPIIMSYPDSIIYEFNDDGIVETLLEETKHYMLMKQFFNDKDRLLHHLFNNN